MPPCYDDIYLSNFATIHVYDELLRINGVSQINGPVTTSRDNPPPVCRHGDRGAGQV